ncbi:UNVERIFIED_CONTAM: putative mitochondrial protein [Sesamum calycinum]|uniref:Mitochondrial protein n=1 Tax=Sesamum calycinum TaxID=2727403 RepID=A0AAW2KQY4_9LAMI
MKAEIDAPERNDTWIIENLPLDKKAIGCKWVYKIKYNSGGTIKRFKARLVVLENNQVERIDYHELLLLWLKWSQFVLFLRLQPFATGSFIRWMFTMLSSMAILMKKCNEVASWFFLFTKKRLFLSQRKYTLDIISEMDLLGAKPASIPNEQNHQLVLQQGHDYLNHDIVASPPNIPYYHLSEVSYVVHVLTQFM